MKEIIKDSIRKNKLKIFVFLVFICFNMYLLTIPPKIIGDIIDLMRNIDINKDVILSKILFLILLSVGILFVRLVWKYYETIIPRTFEKNIVNSMFKHLLRIKVPELQNIKNGEIMSYFVKDLNDTRKTIYRTMSFGSRIIFMVLFTTLSMIRNVNITLTVIALIPLIFASILTILFRKKTDRDYESSQKSFTELSEYIQESTDSIRTTKAYNGENAQISKFENLNEKVRKDNFKVSLNSSFIVSVVNFCFGLSFGLTLLFGSNMILNGTLTIGKFVEFNTYILLFANPVDWLPRLVSMLRTGRLAYARLDSVFKIGTERVQDEKNKLTNSEGILSGDIIIKNLDFSYPGFIDTVLDDINIEIKKGETLGIIGKIGSGKSTLMNLLVKLYRVGNDKIYINGIDINDIPIQVLRENVCYITQDSFLFSSTLKENINLFRDDYDDKDIEDSIRQAIIYDEIMNLPDKINTMVGERGVDLSGGQKQRITISRAFLNKSDIVIFDDTFSALDNRTEQKLLRNIKKLVKGKTCIIVSNRISDIKHADKIIVLDNGKIIEQGTHENLLGEKGTYYNFYKDQAIKVEESFLS